MFTVTGRVSDSFEPVTLVWDDGRLSGDRVAIDALIRRALELDGRPVGPGGEGPFTGSAADHLKSGLSVVSILTEYEWHTVIFDPRFSGDIPRRGDHPLCK
jgi:hypothetical protein